MGRTLPQVAEVDYCLGYCRCFAIADCAVGNIPGKDPRLCPCTVRNHDTMRQCCPCSNNVHARILLVRLPELDTILQTVKLARWVLAAPALAAVESSTLHMAGCLHSESNASCTHYTLLVAWRLWCSFWYILDANTHACTVLAVPEDAVVHSALLAGESIDSLPQVLAALVVVLVVAVPADWKLTAKAIVANLLHSAAE